MRSKDAQHFNFFVNYKYGPNKVELLRSKSCQFRNSAIRPCISKHLPSSSCSKLACFPRKKIRVFTFFNIGVGTRNTTVMNIKVYKLVCLQGYKTVLFCQNHMKIFIKSLYNGTPWFKNVNNCFNTYT
jgi:hypothetical protein